MIKTYQKKPVQIKAIQWTDDYEVKKEAMKWIDENGGKLTLNLQDLTNDAVYIETLEGHMKITEGDFIIQGVKGEFYPCKPDIFYATYDGPVTVLWDYSNKGQEQEQVLELKPEDSNPTIVFYDKAPEEVIKITKGKFYFKGQEVEDKHEVYERFNDWMTIVEEPVSKPTWEDLKFNQTKIDNINW